MKCAIYYEPLRYSGLTSVKIEGIKNLRSSVDVIRNRDGDIVHRGMSLREAKDILDDMSDLVRSYVIELGDDDIIRLIKRGFSVVCAEPEEAVDTGRPDSVSQYSANISGQEKRPIRFFQEVRQNGRIDQIRRLRNALGCGLKEAKEISDEMVAGRTVEVHMTEHHRHALFQAGFNPSPWKIDTFKDVGGELFEI